MSMAKRLPFFPLLTIAVIVAIGAAAAVPGTAQAGSTLRSTGICTSATRPGLAERMSKAITAALRHRTSSVVGLAATDPRDDLTCKLRWSWHFDAASVIKVTIISALLLKVGGPAHLTTKQRDLAWSMITESDNDAATALWNDVGGVPGMQVFLNKAKMRHTELNYAWGLTLITAQDELALLNLLITPGKVLSAKSREYVLWLMAHVIAAERWGVPAGAPADVTVHVKNGWLPYPDADPNADDWHINSIGAFTGHNIGYEIVVLTSGKQSEAYGIDTVQAAARVINKDLAG
jgi:beta-lactamase class A